MIEITADGAGKFHLDATLHGQGGMVAAADVILW